MKTADLANVPVRIDTVLIKRWRACTGVANRGCRSATSAGRPRCSPVVAHWAASQQGCGVPRSVLSPALVTASGVEAEPVDRHDVRVLEAGGDHGLSHELLR